MSEGVQQFKLRKHEHYNTSDRLMLITTDMVGSTIRKKKNNGGRK